MARRLPDGVNGLTLQGGKTVENGAAHGEMNCSGSDGVITQNEGVCVQPSPKLNGKHDDTNGVTDKSLNSDLVNFDLGLGQGESQTKTEVTDSKHDFDPLSPELFSASGTQSQGGKLIDLEQMADTDDIHDASTASVTPSSPPHGATLEFDPLQQEGVQVMSAFGKTGDTLEELGVFEAPPPSADAPGDDLVTFSDGPVKQNGVPASTNPFAADMASLSRTSFAGPPEDKVEPVDVALVTSAVPAPSGDKQYDVTSPPKTPKEAFVSPPPTDKPNDRSESKITPPESPSRKVRSESKLPKKATPPESPKKKVHEPAPPLGETEQANATKLFEKVAPPTSPDKKVQEPAAEAKAAQPKQGQSPTKASPRDKKQVKAKDLPQKQAEEARPDTAPSKIPSPKKERTTPAASAPKKQDGASDSGIEDEKGTPRRTASAGDKKKYGIDAKNTTYKPGGGNVKIFEQKMEVKKVGSRIDAKHSPRKSGESPRVPASKKITETIKTMTPSPNTKNVTSKVGSLSNAKHNPGGGNVRIVHKSQDLTGVAAKCGSTANIKHQPGGGVKKIESRKLDWKVESRVGSMNNATHKPGGGEKKIESQKLDWKAESRIGSLNNAQYKPGGGAKKIESRKLEWNVESKVGSLEKADYKPGGGDKKIESHRLDWNVESKVGSLEKADHKPGGGEKKIESHKVGWNATSRVGSLEKADHKPGGGTKKIESHKVAFREKATSKVGSTKNLKHQAGGGTKKIETHKIEFREKAAPKVGSTKNLDHQPGGGDKQIETHKVDFRDKAEPKVGSTANLEHQATGGDIKIESHKLDFREKAAARTQHGLSPIKVAQAAENST